MSRNPTQFQVLSAWAPGHDRYFQLFERTAALKAQRCLGFGPCAAWKGRSLVVVGLLLVMSKVLGSF